MISITGDNATSLLENFLSASDSVHSYHVAKLKFTAGTPPYGTIIRHLCYGLRQRIGQQVCTVLYCSL